MKKVVSRLRKLDSTCRSWSGGTNSDDQEIVDGRLLKDCPRYPLPAAPAEVSEAYDELTAEELELQAYYKDEALLQPDSELQALIRESLGQSETSWPDTSGSS